MIIAFISTHEYIKVKDIFRIIKILLTVLF